MGEDNGASCSCNNNKDSTSDETEKSSEQFIEGHNTFEDFMKAGFETIMGTIKLSNSLPKGPEFEFLRSYPSFKQVMDEAGNKVLKLMSLILNHQGIPGNIIRRDLEEKYDLIVDANDAILERVGITLDELSGIRRNPDPVSSQIVPTPKPVSGSWNKDVTASAMWKELPVGVNTAPIRLVNARVTQRPQIKFHDKIDNSSSPFVPRIKEKPNALKPLAILYEEYPGIEACYSHPYEYELDMFVEKLKNVSFTKVTPQLPNPGAPLVYVDTEEMLDKMMADLHQHKELAVDLEHHSYRSFQGFTCLMQISTRKTDYIVDTLELRHKLYVLNEVFTDPSVVKVFHGADCDIQWLQRDLCVYVVNMFDTHQAALALSFPRLSLAYLLKHYCNITADKYYQLYDWRTRPLSKEAISYARDDTHYLLYIYDRMRNNILETVNGPQLYSTVLFCSADVCKKRYWKPQFREDGYEEFYKRNKKHFDNRQMFALKELYQWRDKIARDEDESTGYVLPNHMLLHIAEALPKEMQGVLACCNPIPPLVRQHLVYLHQIILKAREQPLTSKPMMSDEMQVRPAVQTTVNMESSLHCPHDLAHEHDSRSDLPTLLGGCELKLDIDEEIVSAEPIISAFEEKESKDTSGTDQRRELLQRVTFLTPYERYKKVLIYLDAAHKENEEHDKQAAKEQEAANKQREEELLKLKEQQKQVEASGVVKMESRSQLLPDSANVKSEDDYSPSKKRSRTQDTLSEATETDTSIVKIEGYGDGRNEAEVEKKPRLENIQTSDNCADNNRHQLISDIVNVSPLKSDTGIEETNHQKKKKKKKQKKQEEGKSNKRPHDDKTASETKKEDKNAKKMKQNEGFHAFDYSKVDYSKFQSQQNTNTTNEFTPKFKGKGNRGQKFSSKHNRSMTFSKGGGGRGGGRR